MKLSDFFSGIGLELDEAFAAQVMACDRELHFDSEKLNVNGGGMGMALALEDVA